MAHKRGKAKMENKCGGEVSAALDETLLAIMGQLQMEGRPSYQNAQLPLKNLVLRHVNNPAIVRDANNLAESINLMGILLPPIVVPLEDARVDDPEGRFLVIDGRRRTLGGLIAGLEKTECRVYSATLTPQLQRLVTAASNIQRRSEWRSEVEALHELVSERIGLSREQLLQAGFANETLSERLAIACLPDPIIEQVAEGLVNQVTARRLCRLTERRLAEFVTSASLGQKIEATAVERSLRAQITPSAVPLDDTWTHSGSLQEPEEVFPSCDGKQSQIAEQLMALVLTMQQLEPVLGSSEEAKQVRFLFKALGKLLPVLARQHGKEPSHHDEYAEVLN